MIRASKRPGGPERIMDMANAFHRSCVLFAALELDIFTQLESLGEADVDSLARACDVSRRGLRLLLDGCAALGLLEKKDGLYHNAEEARSFLVKDSPAYLGEAIRYNRDVYPLWGRLKELVHSGEPVEKPETHLGEDKGRTETFVRAMHRRAMAIGRGVVPQVDLGKCSSLLDIGGGSGAYSMLLAEKYPQLSCVVFDLPGVVEVAKSIVSDADVGDRIDFHPGDYRKDAFPSGFDAAALFGVLHQEGPESISNLLEFTYHALNPGGVVYVLDMMTDESRCRPPFSAPCLLSIWPLQAGKGGFSPTVTSRNGWKGRGLRILNAAPSANQCRTGWQKLKNRRNKIKF